MSKVAIIGAGVIGSSIALELSRNGDDVIVIDKGAGAGQGSTSASSAIIRFNYSTLDSIALAWESYHCWKNWREHLGVELTSYSQLFDVGVLMLDAPEIAKERIAELYTQAKIPFELWDKETLAMKIPHLDTGKYGPPKSISDEGFWEDSTDSLGALFTPQGGYVNDPLLAAENLADAARSRGAQFKFKSVVTKIIQRENRIIGVEINGSEMINAEVVVNACGPWSGEINKMAGVGSDFTISVRPMRQEVHQVNAPLNLLPGPIMGDLDLGIYMRGTPNGGLLVGGTEPECDPLEWVDDVDQVNTNRTQERFEAQVTRAARRLPALQIPNTPLGIVGVYDVASDWTPIYDKTELNGFYVAIGTSGNQFKNAPMVGKIMCQLISEVEAGRNHDDDPVIHKGFYTGNEINLKTFSRKRPYNANTSGTVMG
ncbi:MAG: FAD-dependent oxidoreductase [Actinomycetes bacterium]